MGGRHHGEFVLLICSRSQAYAIEKDFIFMRTCACQIIDDVGRELSMGCSSHISRFRRREGLEVHQDTVCAEARMENVQDKKGVVEVYVNLNDCLLGIYPTLAMPPSMGSCIIHNHTILRLDSDAPKHANRTQALVPAQQDPTI
jgi:hypothetical protein